MIRDKPQSMTTHDVLCIGNAIVDVIARCEDHFLAENDIIKGAMNLVDAERAEALYARMAPAPRSPTSKAISGIRRAPRRRSSTPQKSPMRTAARLR